MGRGRRAPRGLRGAARARPHRRFPPPRIHFIPDSLTYQPYAFRRDSNPQSRLELLDLRSKMCIQCGLIFGVFISEATQRDRALGAVGRLGLPHGGGVGDAVHARARPPPVKRVEPLVIPR